MSVWAVISIGNMSRGVMCLGRECIIGESVRGRECYRPREDLELLTGRRLLVFSKISLKNKVAEGT